MTNVLLGDYPDVFKAGAAFMGVPFGCFATTDGSMWNSQCANGQHDRTPQQWGDLVRDAYPGYTGARPRMQIWHGTNDTTLRYPNFGEPIKQWTNVHGLSQTPTFTDTPQSDWTRTRYGGTGTRRRSRRSACQGAGHSLPRAAGARWRSRSSASTTTPRRRRRPPPTSRPPPSRARPPPATRRPHHGHATPPAAGACRVTYTINAWNTGLTANDHHHQHRHRRRQRLVAGVHPAGRTDHHLGLERHLLADQRAGDGAQHDLQRHHRAQRVRQHRLPGHPHRQHRQAAVVHPQRQHLHHRLATCASSRVLVQQRRAPGPVSAGSGRTSGTLRSQLPGGCCLRVLARQQRLGSCGLLLSRAGEGAS